MKTTANEQAFQSIYLDDNPESWEEKIVFLEPLFDTLPPAEMLFKTLRLEDNSGIVIGGPKASLLKLKEHIHSADAENAIGKANDEEIIRYLVEVSREHGLTDHYSQTVAEARLRIQAEKLGLNIVEDLYLSSCRTKAATILHGKLVGLSTSDFKLRGINSLACIFDEDTWPKSDKKLNLKDPMFIPTGIKKVEAARWFLNAKRITKPLNILETIANLAEKAGCTSKESVVSKFKEKFMTLGMDIWSDETETEYIGFTTLSDYDSGSHPEQVAYIDVATGEMTLTNADKIDEKVLALIDEVYNNLG